jgi:UDP-GlcNAc:undecaprenyl-phosphate GlcNAc-1-phosphate transferase
MALNFFIISTILSLVFTFFIRKLALRWGVVDKPNSARKIHSHPVPLLGGLAIFCSFFLFLFIIKRINGWPTDLVLNKRLIGIFFAGLILMIGGWLDDKYDFKPHWQIIWPILACLTVIASGIGIEYINNPLFSLLNQGDKYFYLNQPKIEIIRLGEIPYYFTPWSDLITFIWLMILMYSTKLLDGLDGLVSGLCFIGCLGIAGLCFLTKFYQLDIGLISIILSGCFLGFLFFNWHPAKIFLGEGGSLFAGFILGVVSIISGSKIATTFLISGLAIIDLLGVIIQRIINRSSPFIGDKRHLHFRLLEAGLSHRLTVIFYWLVALVFGLVSLFLKTKGKIISLLALFVLAICLIARFFIKERLKEKYGK